MMVITMWKSFGERGKLKNNDGLVWFIFFLTCRKKTTEANEILQKPQHKYSFCWDENK